MALAGILPAHADVMSFVTDQVEVEGPRFFDSNPNDQLRFLQRAQYKHLGDLARLFSPMFPQSIIVSLLPAHIPADDIAEAIVQFIMPFFQHLWPVAFRMDNLKVDPSRCPGLQAEEMLPVCTVFRQDTNGVLFCLHVRPPLRQSEPWRPDMPAGHRLAATFRSALLLMGPTSDVALVRNTLLSAYVAMGGWIICGRNAMLYDVPALQMVDCATPETRLKQNSLALARAALGQLCTSKRPVRIRFVQAYLRLSDHFGWPVPEGALDELLSNLLQQTEKVQLLDGGRLLLNGAGQQLSHAEIVLLQLVRSALEADDGRLLKDFLSNVVSPDPAPEYHPVTGSLRAEEDLPPPPHHPPPTVAPSASATTAAAAAAASTKERIESLRRELMEIEERRRQLERRDQAVQPTQSPSRASTSTSPSLGRNSDTAQQPVGRRYLSPTPPPLRATHLRTEIKTEIPLYQSRVGSPDPEPGWVERQRKRARRDRSRSTDRGRPTRQKR